MKLRTIPQYVSYCKSKDSDTCINASMIRRLIDNGQIRCAKIGTRHVIDSDAVDSYFLQVCSIRYDIL